MHQPLNVYRLDPVSDDGTADSVQEGAPHPSDAERPFFPLNPGRVQVPMLPQCP